MSSAILVMPCYHEAQRLQIQAFKDYACDGRAQQFLFVNDGSTAGTLRVLQTLRDEDPQRYAVCELPRNVGKAEAVRRGVLLACDADPDYIGYWDADLATPLEAIPGAGFCQGLCWAGHDLWAFLAAAFATSESYTRRGYSCPV